MKIKLSQLVAAGLGLLGLLIVGIPAALANDLKGIVESVSSGNQSFVIQGITFFTTPSTEYEEGLRSFADLKPGQRVEVDFLIRDGRHYVKEVELD